MNLTTSANAHIKRFKQLVLGKKTEDNSRLLSEKFSSELSTISELISHIDNTDTIGKKTILSELGTFMQIKEFNKGHFFRKIYETNNDFMMLLRGKIMEFEIKYINISMSFQEFILFVIKLYLLNEKFIYWDCIEKNCEAFPFNIFKYFIDNWSDGIKMPEEEKNSGKKWIKDINVIEICKELNMKNFDFEEELKKIKNKINKSYWKNFDANNKKLTEAEYSNLIKSFFEIYNSNIDIENKEKSIKDVKYKVCLPYFFMKRIIKPISYIGDLNRPIQLKNYSSLVCLNDCFIIYINKLKINPTRLLYKYIYNNKVNYIAENLFKKHFLFKNINVDYLNTFGKYMTVINMNKNEILFKQGEPHKGVYIVINGSVQLDTYQSYKDLIYVNFLLMHSLDYCPNFISNMKKKEMEMKKNKSYLNGYYDYNSDLNNLMKNPIFKEKAIIKDNIIFYIYKKNDIIGLGEFYDYKNKINIFTAKAISNDTEIIFIPNEVFQALLSCDLIYNQCGIITVENKSIFNRCIDKYKKLFEKKIESLINKKKIRMINKKTKNKENIFKIIKKIGFDTKNNCNFTGGNILKFNKINNKIQSEENDKINRSYHEKGNLTLLNKDNDINIENNNNQENKKIIISRTNQKFLSNNNTLKISNFETNDNLVLSDSKFPKIFKKSALNRRNHILKSTVCSQDNDTKKRYEDFSDFFSGEKIKRISGPIFFSYDFNNENKQMNKRNKKLKIRSLSAQKYEENDIKKTILNYKNNYKEMKKYYNNISGNEYKNKNMNFFVNNNSNINKDIKNMNILNKKKMIINKFSSNSLFRRSATKNTTPKQNVF